MDLTEMEGECVELALDKDEWRAVLNTVMILRFL
jgi:hypothetical protein